MIEDAIGRWAEAKGARFAVAGVEVIEEVRGKLEERRDKGLIDGALFRRYLSGFGYREGCGVADPEAVLLISLRSPVHVVSFELEGRTFDGLLPSTYHRYQAVFTDVMAELKKAVGEGVPIGLLKAPLKSLSVRMGLSLYGRNNVTYVSDFGSYHQLCGYVVGGEPGRRLREAFAGPLRALESPLERCAACRACRDACPAGAIREDRFLLSAEKCNTLFSEARGHLPGGIRAAGPACLVGCLACQVVCPENKGKLPYERLDVVFTDPETRALLELGRLEAAGKGREKRTAPAGVTASVWATVQEKFDRLQLSEDLEAVARNLLPIAESC
jgi:epoxyqueuosine reductase